MRLLERSAPVLLLSVIVACGSEPTSVCCTTGEPSLRVVNAFPSPVEILIDGEVAIASLAAGAIDTMAPAAGTHTLALRATDSGSSATRSITTTAGALGTVAIVRAVSGAVSSAVLDDTNAVVPAGATKLRVLHLAPNAGTLQVYRTQPDFQQPVAWQFPFDYQPEPTSLSAPFYQSTAGEWEVRIWQTPADASGWDAATVRVVVPLASGEKKTVVILDATGGGIKVELL